MKTKHVIGKRIIRIKQEVTDRGHGYKPVNAIDYILLEDGTRLYPVVMEGEADYYVDLSVNRENLHRKGKP